MLELVQRKYLKRGKCIEILEEMVKNYKKDNKTLFKWLSSLKDQISLKFDDADEEVDQLEKICDFVQEEDRKREEEENWIVEESTQTELILWSEERN